MIQKIKDICKIILTIILLIIFILFIFNNAEIIKINLFPFSYVIEIRLFLLIIFVFILGILFSTFINLIKNIFNIQKIKNNYKIKNIEKELKTLKNKYENENKKI